MLFLYYLQSYFKQKELIKEIQWQNRVQKHIEEYVKSRLPILFPDELHPQYESNNRKVVEFTYDELTQEWIGDLDKNTSIVVKGLNRTLWASKIKGVFYE